MEPNNLEPISLSDSELSINDEGPYINIATTDINIDTSSEYFPNENYIHPYTIPFVQNEINEVPLTLPIEYLSAAREILILMATIREQSTNETWLDPQLQNYNFSSFVSGRTSGKGQSSGAAGERKWMGSKRGRECERKIVRGKVILTNE